MTTIDLLILIVNMATAVIAQVLKGNRTAESVEKISASLTNLVKAANDAHVQETGQPIDLSKLGPIEPVK